MKRGPQPALTVRQVAAYLNVNEKTVYRLAQRGELPGFKVAGAWRFQWDDLERWIAARKQSASRTLARQPKTVRKVQGDRPEVGNANAMDAR